MPPFTSIKSKTFVELDDRQDLAFHHFLKPFQLKNQNWTCLLFQDTKYPISDSLGSARRSHPSLDITRGITHPSLDITRGITHPSLDHFQFKEFKTRNDLFETIRKESIELYNDFMAASLLVKAYLTNSHPDPWAINYLNWKLNGPGLGIMADGSLSIVTDDGVTISLELEDVFKTFEKDEINCFDLDTSASTVSTNSSFELVPICPDGNVSANDHPLLQFSHIAMDYFEKLKNDSRKKYAAKSLCDLEDSAIQILTLASTQSHSLSYPDTLTNTLLQTIQSHPPSFIEYLVHLFPGTMRGISKTLPLLYSLWIKIKTYPYPFHIYKDQLGYFTLAHTLIEKGSNPPISKQNVLKKIYAERPDLKLYWLYCSCTLYQLKITQQENEHAIPINQWLSFVKSALFPTESFTSDEITRQILLEYTGTESPQIQSQSYETFVKSSPPLEQDHLVPIKKKIKEKFAPYRPDMIKKKEKKKKRLCKKSRTCETFRDDHLVPF